jgi:hypothetical protein
MISKTHLSTILFFAAIIWGILLVIGGVAVSISWLRYISTVTGILLLLLGTFDKWLWRLSFLQGWFVKRPIIRGTWQAILRSKWVDPATGKCIEPVNGFMVIRQTYSSLSLRLLTDESSSELIGAEVITLSDGTMRMAGVYRNEPRQLLRERSSMHNGAILLEIIGRPVTCLRGHYWTDRNTSGEIELKNRRNEIFHDYETAKKHFDSIFG